MRLAADIHNPATVGQPARPAN